jgi:hypothetical protein
MALFPGKNRRFLVEFAKQTPRIKISMDADFYPRLTFFLKMWYFITSTGEPAFTGSRKPKRGVFSKNAHF